MGSEPILVAEAGPLEGQTWVITTEGLRIGREEGNEIMVDDAAVSRQHARVLMHNGAVWLQDTGSRNGVFVNGDRVPDHRQLKPGDRIMLGAHVFRVDVPSGGGGKMAARPPTKGGGSGKLLIALGLAAVAILGIVGCTGIALWFWWSR